MTGLEMLAAASVAATAGGTLMQVAGNNQANKAQKEQAASVAAQQEAAAKEAVATAQRRAFDKDAETALVQSKLQAQAAMGGGGADDVGVVDLGEKIAAKGTYNALAEIYKGETRSDNLNDEAEATRATSRARSQASRMQNATTIMGGINSLATNLVNSKVLAPKTPTAG